jgi:hypothetical protein
VVVARRGVAADSAVVVHAPTLVSGRLQDDATTAIAVTGAGVQLDLLTERRVPYQADHCRSQRHEGGDSKP